MGMGICLEDGLACDDVEEAEERWEEDEDEDGEVD